MEKKDAEFDLYINKFPEDAHNFTHSNCFSEKKVKKKEGLKLLEYLIFTLLSDFDNYSILDLKAGLQIYEIDKMTPIHWKFLLEMAFK